MDSKPSVKLILRAAFALFVVGVLVNMSLSAVWFVPQKNGYKTALTFMFGLIWLLPCVVFFFIDTKGKRRGIIWPVVSMLIFDVGLLFVVMPIFSNDVRGCVVIERISDERVIYQCIVGGSGSATFIAGVGEITMQLIESRG